MNYGQLSSRGIGASRRMLAIFFAVAWTLFALADVAFGALAVDSVSSDTPGAGTVFTWNHTVSGTDRLLLVGVSSRRSVNTVTYGGQAMTLVIERAPNNGAMSSIWQLTSPATGTAQVSVTLSVANYATCGAISYTGVDLVTPISTSAAANAQSNNASVTIASAAGEMVFDVVTARRGSTTVTVGAGQTELWNGNTGVANADLGGGASTEPGAASVTMSWAISASQRWASVAVSVKPNPVLVGRNQMSYRWADNAEIVLADENTAYGASLNEQLHLRVALEKIGSSWSTHRLGLQVATNAAFTGASILPAGNYWDDAGHADGDSVTGTKLLSSIDANGEYHEAPTTSTEIKSMDTTYEEDFAIVADATGTYYLRVVEVDSAGALVSLLDGYSSTIQVNVTTANVKQTGFAWAPNAAVASGALVWGGDDTDLQFATGTNYILAVQVALDSNAGNTWQLQFQEDYDTASPGAWTNVAVGNAWRTGTENLTDLNNNSVVPTASYSQANEVGYAVATGEFATDSTVNDNYVGGRCVELWYAIRPVAASLGHSYRFRVIETGTAFTYIVSPTARCPAREQVAYRWLEFNEGFAGSENTLHMSAEDQTLHLRVAIKSRLEDWTGKYLALQLDDNVNFTSPTLMTAAVGNEFTHWDDPGHTTGDPVSGAKVLSTTQADGLYAESNVVAPHNFTSDTTYEFDFTVLVDYLPAYNADEEWFFRVVEVNSAGVLQGTLDIYSEIPELWCGRATNRQTAFNWASDAAALTWPPLKDQTLSYTPGNRYILAVQSERVYAGNSSTWDWELQYQEDPDGVPGEWVEITTSTANDWATTNNTETYNVHNNNNAVTPAQFVCGGGVGTATNGEYGNDANGIQYPYIGSTYTEFWYAVQPQATSANKSYAFRVVRNGTTGALAFKLFPRAVNQSDQQVSYRWSDISEIALANENEAYVAATDEQLHLRAGIKRQGGDWSSHYLALQWDDNASFSSPTLVTSSSATVSMWDDPGNSDGGAVSSSLILTGASAGAYHEDNVTTAATKTADVLYEEDFTVEVDTAGVYYLRVVEVTNAGALASTLDSYNQTIILEVQDPVDFETNFNWATDANVAAGSLVWQGAGTSLAFTSGSTYILGMQMKHESAAGSDYDWTLQYQKDPDGTPGPWTTVTSSSSDWRTDGTPAFVAIANEGTVATGVFSMASPGGVPAPTATAGELSSDSNGATHTLTGDPVYTEYWFPITPQAAASGDKYRFRITNNSSTSGFTYVVYAIAAEDSQEQIGYRWSDEDNIAIGAKDNSISVNTGTQLHLRLGVQSLNGAWNGHRLGLQFDASPSFASAAMMRQGSGNLRMWDDTDHADASLFAGVKLLEPPAASYGYRHETHDGAPSQSFADGVIVEEDFAVEGFVDGTYYIRVVEVDGSGSFVRLLDTYNEVIQLQVQAAADTQSGYEWGLDTGGAPAWQGDDTEVGYTAGTKYVLGVQIHHQSATDSEYSWQLQYQEFPYLLVPGTWTTITRTSDAWQTIDPDNVGKINEGSVATGELSQAAPVGAGGSNAGEYSDDSNGAQYIMQTNNDYTELWFTIRPNSDAIGKQYRFRVTNAGSPNGINYPFYPFAYDVYLFEGSGTTAWGTASNWVPPVVPDNNHTTRIPTAAVTDPVLTGTSNVLGPFIVDAGMTVNINGSGDLLLGQSPTWDGSLSMAANSRLQLPNGGILDLDAGQSFTIAGTAAQPAVITSPGAGNYISLDLGGPVDIDYLTFTNPADNGLTFSGSGGAATAADHVTLSGIAPGNTYSIITGSDWDNTVFDGWSFGDPGGAGAVTMEITTGADVYMDSYVIGAGFLSGEASDIDEDSTGPANSGRVMWAAGPAFITRIGVFNRPDGLAVAWSTGSELNIAGFHVYRTRLPGIDAPVKPWRAKGWQRLTAGNGLLPGLDGLPAERHYRFIDTTAEPGLTYAYVVVELNLGGGLRCRHEPLTITVPAHPVGTPKTR